MKAAAKVLIENGADINATDSGLWTPILMAAFSRTIFTTFLQQIL